MNRRSFISLTLAGAGSGPSLFAATAAVPGTGETYPGWKPGELDLHFIHTGRGENCFHVLPDGTTILNDTGDYYRPHEMAEIPWMPKGRDELLGGDVVARYIRRLFPSLKKLDYALVSHWHSDHTGNPALRTKAAADGRKVCGMALVGEYFDVGRFYDHQFPNIGKYGDGDVGGREMVREWVAAKKIPQEPFHPGALDQIKLMHDPEGKYRGRFSIRNICANAVCWTGKGEETFDYAAANLANPGGADILGQNTLSMGYVIQYGGFRFFTGGDVSAPFGLFGPDGKKYDFEGLVGRVVGPVAVCKTNHHAYRDAMKREFVDAVRAQTYVTCVWAPSHVQDCNMYLMSSREMYPGDRTVFVTQVPDLPRRTWPRAPWWKDIAPDGHIVVKVAPGGGSYRVYVLDPSDESMRVKAVFDREVRS